MSAPITLAEQATRDRLAGWIAPKIGASSVRITGAEKLAGGAVQENWSVGVDVTGGPRQGPQSWVLRTDAPASISVSLDRASEYAVLQAAHQGGVAVAEPIARCADAAIVGRPFLIQQRLTGNAQARRITRDPALTAYGDALAGHLGEELARIHAIRPPQLVLSALPIPMLPPARVEVAKFRGALDGATESRPALEYILSWLDRNAPTTSQVCLVHGDYRTGNYMVEAGTLTGILDWEFSHWGDGDEDIGWFTARCWRFGNDAKEAGGIGDRAAFIRSYERFSGRTINPARIAYWEIMAAAKWATIAVLQGDRFRKGGEESIELALTGLMPPEMELDALDGIIAIEAKTTKGGRP